MSKTALIAGATGLTGSYLVEQLLAGQEYKTIKIFTRRHAGFSDPRIVEIIMDFEELKDKSRDLSFLEADDVYCCLGTTIKTVGGDKDKFYNIDHNYPVLLAKTCLKYGAKQFLVISALGADPGSSIFYNRVKGEMEDSLKAVGYSSLHIFQPSLLLGDRKEERTGEDLAKKVTNWFSFLFSGPFKKYRPIHASVVAGAMIRKAEANTPGRFTYDSPEIAEIGTA